MIATAPIYSDVVYGNNFSEKFSSWAKQMLQGKASIGQINGRATCIIFDCLEDFTTYNLSWPHIPQENNLLSS